jgi:antitoxin HicB
MSKRDKLLERLRRLPPEVSYEDIAYIPIAFGLEEVHSKGSHHTFRHADGRKLTVPKVGGKTVKRTYIRQVLKIIGEDYMQQSLEYYLSLKYPITLHEEPEGGYTAVIADLPGCASTGETYQEVLEMIDDARQAWIEVAYRHGDVIPLPHTLRNYSGKTLVRMPPSLHQALAEAAERQGVSLNHYIIMLLSQQSTFHLLDQRLNHLQSDITELKRTFNLTAR